MYLTLSRPPALNKVELFFQNLAQTLTDIELCLPNVKRCISSHLTRLSVPPPPPIFCFPEPQTYQTSCLALTRHSPPPTAGGTGLKGEGGGTCPEYWEVECAERCWRKAEGGGADKPGGRVKGEGRGETNVGRRTGRDSAADSNLGGKVRGRGRGSEV